MQLGAKHQNAFLVTTKVMRHYKGYIITIALSAVTVVGIF